MSFIVILLLQKKTILQNLQLEILITYTIEDFHMYSYATV